MVLDSCECNNLPLIPERNWLQHGSLELDDVTMSYAEDLPPVLRGLSIKIAAGEKVAIDSKLIEFLWEID